MDTLRVMERLTENGAFTQAQARALVDALRESEREDLATRSDLTTAKDGLRAEIANFKAGLRVEIANFKADLRAEIAKFGAELKAEIANTKAEILRWMFSAMAVQVFAIVGLVRLLFVD